MFGIGMGELMLVCIAVLIIYGPKRLPELAKKLGRITNDVRKATDDVRNAIRMAGHTIEQENQETNVRKKPLKPFSADDTVVDTDILKEKKSDGKN